MGAVFHTMNREKNRRFPHRLRHTLRRVFMSVSANRPNAVTRGHIPTKVGGSASCGSVYWYCDSECANRMTEALRAGLPSVAHLRQTVHQWSENRAVVPLRSSRYGLRLTRLVDCLRQQMACGAFNAGGLARWLVGQCSGLMRDEG